MATIAGWPLRYGRRSERRAARPTGSKTLGQDVRTARRFEGHRKAVRSRDSLHLAISFRTVEADFALEPRRIASPSCICRTQTSLSGIWPIEENTLEETKTTRRYEPVDSGVTP